MEHAKALMIKFVMVTAVLGLILSAIFGGELVDTLFITLVLTVLAYLFGDLFIFRFAGDNYTSRNIIATFSDAVLAFVVVYFIGTYMYSGVDNMMLASLVAALAVGGGEWFFHKYLNNHVLDEREDHPRVTS